MWQINICELLFSRYVKFQVHCFAAVNSSHSTKTQSPEHFNPYPANVENRVSS
jgi:exonuclease V gamma subunit